MEEEGGVGVGCETGDGVGPLLCFPVEGDGVGLLLLLCFDVGDGVGLLLCFDVGNGTVGDDVVGEEVHITLALQLHI